MKRKAQRVMMVMALTAVTVTLVSGLCLAADRTVSFAATAVKPEEVNAAGSVIDNFNDNGILNNLGGTPAPWGTDASNYPYNAYEGVVCLKIEYDVTMPGSFSGYTTPLTPTGKDLSAYTTLSFWVKGASGGEFFKIEMKTNTGTYTTASVYVSDFLDGGVTTSWRQVVIPLHNFANIGTWTSAKELGFVFENVQATNNGSPVAGTIYIDKIELGNAAVSQVRVAPFGNKISISALGGNLGPMSDGGGTATCLFSTVAGQYTPYSYGLATTYNVVSGWSGVYMIFGGGNNGFTAAPHNFSAYTYLKFNIKAGSTTANPKALKVEILYNGGKKEAIIGGIVSTGWITALVPLSGADKTTLKQVNLIFDSGTIDSAGGNRAGLVYIDNVRFE